MMLANHAGWFVLNPIAVRVTWNGGAGPRDLIVEYARTPPPQHAVVSYFGHGVVTWRIPILFRTPRGVQLLVRGPANSPKRDVYALEGIVETSWSIATFTMNWKLLTPSVPVIFEENEPICMLVPYRVSDIERVKPVMTSIFADPSLVEAYKAWSGQRFEFIGTRATRVRGRRTMCAADSAISLLPMNTERGFISRPFAKNHPVDRMTAHDACRLSRRMIGPARASGLEEQAGRFQLHSSCATWEWSAASG